MPPMPDKTVVLLPEPYLVAIGKVCVQWSMLEAQMDHAIKKLCGFEIDDSRALILTTHMAWPLRMDIMESLINAYRSDHPHLAHYDALKPQLKKAAEGRNRFVHAHLAYENGEVIELRAKARGKLQTTVTPIQVSEIEVVADDIGRAAINVYKTIFNRMGG